MKNTCLEKTISTFKQSFRDLKLTSNHESPKLMMLKQVLTVSNKITWSIILNSALKSETLSRQTFPESRPTIM